ncbi:protein sidekick-like [Drosophila navojoa]|uniref:protein sidekick-like n=1 Tax=Drosophila navojoa TaxID=7232 RepID=UPI0011BF82A1|nr:protein sidekick-like [Drosophila navojoa]
MHYACTLFTGSPQPTYRWLKDGIPVADYSSSQFYRIHNTKREDAGSYQCIARNEAGSIFSEKSEVVVAYMGTFENQNEGHLTVVSGHPAIFDMPAIDSVPKPSVSWQAENRTLNYDIKYALTQANQLIVLSADKQDVQAYRAHAMNTQLGREEASALIYLNVTGDPFVEVAPEIIVPPQDLKLKRGEGVAELQCIANARPLHELETIWLKDGLPVENAGILHTLNNPWNRTLALLQANSSHAGEYTCQVRLRSGGFQTVTANAHVYILEPPMFFTPMRAETFGDFGGQVMLPCDVVGDPTPQVQWFRNAERIEAQLLSGGYSVKADNTLIIKKLTLEDEGMFQCLATNEAGEKSAYTWLRVKTATTEAAAVPQPRVKRLAQPRILRVRASHAGMGSGPRSGSGSGSSLGSGSGSGSGTGSGSGMGMNAKHPGKGNKRKEFRFGMGIKNAKPLTAHIHYSTHCTSN